MSAVEFRRCVAGRASPSSRIQVAQDRDIPIQRSTTFIGRKVFTVTYDSDRKFSSVPGVAGDPGAVGVF
jgi:hypothetical protein